MAPLPKKLVLTEVENCLHQYKSFLSTKHTNGLCIHNFLPKDTAEISTIKGHPIFVHLGSALETLRSTLKKQRFSNISMVVCFLMALQQAQLNQINSQIRFYSLFQKQIIS